MEKMTIEKAREIISWYEKHGSLGHRWGRSSYHYAIIFLEGHDSRQLEIEESNK